MKKSDKMIATAATTAISTVLAAAAILFAMSYNALFVKAEQAEASAVSGSSLVGNVMTVNMGMSEIQEDVSDKDLQKFNTYGFPTGETPYFIYVEKGAHTLSVFSKDDYGLYTVRLATWSTATGRTSSLTPTGVFEIGSKEEWHKWPANTYSPYVSTYYVTNNHYGGLFIHGPIYRNQVFSSVLASSVSRIGTNCSSGCLRTETEAAYFVYTMCAPGTQVKIVEGSPLGFTPDRKVQLYNQTSQPTLESLSVNAVVPDQIAFSEESHAMVVGEEYKPEVVTTPSYARNINGTWSTNNPSIVKVSGGTIWAVGTGTAIVTLTTADGGLTASMLINVHVGTVDTSAAPPDVGGKVTVNTDHITEHYQPISENLIYLKINGTNYGINQPVQPLLRTLGRNYHITHAQSCAYEGLDKVFSYTYSNKGSCQISTVPLLAGEDTICEVNIRNYFTKTLESSQGITLGNSRSDVEKAYGKYYTEEVADAVDGVDSYVRMIYWAGEPNKPGVAYLYFILDPDNSKVTGMGIFSGRNIG